MADGVLISRGQMWIRAWVSPEAVRPVWLDEGCKDVAARLGPRSRWILPPDFPATVSEDEDSTRAGDNSSLFSPPALSPCKSG